MSEPWVIVGYGPGVSMSREEIMRARIKEAHEARTTSPPEPAVSAAQARQVKADRWFIKDRAYQLSIKGRSGQSRYAKWDLDETVWN